MKGWRHRYELLSRFDEGIAFDKEGFESSKSESVARFIATHLPGETVLDAFTGLGACAIAFAQQGKQVVSIDINAARSKMAQSNAAIYGVEKRIKFIVGDTLKLWRRLDFDAAYFDPPWGGLGYEKLRSRSFSSFDPPILRLIRTMTNLGKNVSVTLPLNFDFNELKRIKRGVTVHFSDQYGRPYCVHCIWLSPPDQEGPVGQIGEPAAGPAHKSPSR